MVNQFFLAILSLFCFVSIIHVIYIISPLPDIFLLYYVHQQNIFLAGIEISSITLVWVMTELAKNPTLMKKAQEEIRNKVGNKGKVV